EARAIYDTYLAKKRSGARRRLRKVVATMSAAFVLSGASSLLFIIWFQGEKLPLAQGHANSRLSAIVPAVPIPRFVSGTNGAAGRLGGDAEMATVSSMEPNRVAETGATQAPRVDAQTTNSRKVQARWIAYLQRRTPHASNVAHSDVHMADARLEAVGATQAKLEQAVRMLDKGEQFLAQGNIAI